MFNSMWLERGIYYNIIRLMRRVNWTITEKQHKELQRLSRRTGLPISELVRRSLDKYLGLVGEEPLRNIDDEMNHSS